MALQTEYVENVQSTPGYVTLQYTPLNANEVSFDPIGGPAQVLGQDYLVIGNRLYWDHASIPSSDIKEVVLGGFVIDARIMYERA
jgi:hypothetical protein